jgi:hypothetical protein
MTRVTAARAAETRSRWPIQASIRAGTARASTVLGRTRATKGSSSSISEPISVVTPPGPEGSSARDRTGPDGPAVPARPMGLTGFRAAASAQCRTAALVRRAAASVQASQAQVNRA